jgi:hypothetical protein
MTMSDRHDTPNDPSAAPHHRNPFALARQQRILRRAGKAKALWRAKHAAGPEDYLSDTALPLPAGFKTPDALRKYENFIPAPVRQAELRAKHLSRAFYAQHRKHRMTNKSRGPHINDEDIIIDIDRYVEDYGIEEREAAKILADALTRAECIEHETARARIRRARRKLTLE